MQNLLRLASINFTLARYGLDEVVSSIHFFRPLYLLARINPFNWFRSDDHSQAERLRLCIEELGPIFIKFGQLLSTPGQTPFGFLKFCRNRDGAQQTAHGHLGKLQTIQTVGLGSCTHWTWYPAGRRHQSGQSRTLNGTG